ncbi:histidine phosphatase family protein [Roseivivax isoporae]|uniref:Phosphoglycerate mutase n=1 Tax=Roseivivax isoporae LMG 25204 TaxID=1449351 RepID=X7F696_9RHOB|nr:histidine phosphatase family protein [Roseivivax isoporae]ETX28273.1 phosphoglycerate mutase [Roseivivax isoporae LMG 25204]
MTRPAPMELILVRHAPAAHGGRLCGRTDVPAERPGEAVLAPLRALLSDARTVVSSPALRCTATAGWLFPDRAVPVDARLWEQDFGTMDGAPFAALPDLGPLDRQSLTAHAYPGGEDFTAMAARAGAALGTLADSVRAGGGPAVVVAHAGTVRAGLALALGDAAAALAFEVAPLSATRLRVLDAGYSVVAVNWSGAAA